MAGQQPSSAPAPSLAVVLRSAGRKALGGGISGALAMVVQVVALMWMRTTINFQYAKGMTMFGALKFLYADGKGELTGMRGTFAGIPAWPRLAERAARGGTARFHDCGVARIQLYDLSTVYVYIRCLSISPFPSPLLIPVPSAPELSEFRCP